MKNIILFMTAVAFANTMYAQQSSGAIIYQNIVNLHRQFTGEREGMKTMVPEFRTTLFQLSFNEDATLYKPFLEDEVEDFGSASVAIKLRQPYREIYYDKSTRIRTRQQEFMGKTYLMEESIKIPAWKLGDETREINGYTCRLAYYTDTLNNTDTLDNMEVTAWYTVELPPFTGPENFNTLPGTVLAVDINNSERVLLAKTVDLRELKKNELKKPTKGIEITTVEYNKMTEGFGGRMRQRGGGNRRN